MDARQHIYYALGILVYAMAKADGKVQDEEKKKLFAIVKEETKHTMDFQYAEIIFQLLEKNYSGIDGIYRWAISELEKGRHYLSPEIKQRMLSVMRQIAGAFNSVTVGEQDILTKFQSDLDRIGVEHFLK